MQIPTRLQDTTQSSFMVEKLKTVWAISGILLTDLLKVFDCLRHDLLIAKLAAYDFDQQSLRYVYSYLSDWTQRTKVNNAYSSYANIKYSVPQCCILVPLLFNIDICDLFLWDYTCDMASYADDNAPYTSGRNLNLVFKKLESSTHDPFRWFKENHMIKVNPDKCQHLVTSNS